MTQRALIPHEKRRIPYAEALPLAHEIEAILAPVCDRIQIAGSIRRQSCTVGDIEIVCIPKRVNSGMFGDEAPIGVANQAYQFLLEKVMGEHPDYGARLKSDGSRMFGKLMMLLTYKGFALDVFCTTPEQWGVTLLIRTGSDDFSRSFAMRKSEGGRLMTGQVLKDWRIVDCGTPLETPEEQDVFRVTSNEWIEPEGRS